MSNVMIFLKTVRHRNLKVKIKNLADQNKAQHKCFKCWWLALHRKKTITKPLMNSTFNLGLPTGTSYAMLTKIK